MAKGVGNFIKGPVGKVIGIALVLVALTAAAIAARNLFGESPLARNSRERTFVCADTGKPFEYTIKKGDMYPVPSPHSGKNTGYPAEFCYWTADGKVKQEPTAVLLNTYTGKPGATFCPDCARLVVSFNPMPLEGDPPPPKQSEYKPRRGVSAEESSESAEPRE